MSIMLSKIHQIKVSPLKIFSCSFLNRVRLQPRSEQSSNGPILQNSFLRGLEGVLRGSQFSMRIHLIKESILKGQIILFAAKCNFISQWISYCYCLSNRPLYANSRKSMHLKMSYFSCLKFPFEI